MASDLDPVISNTDSEGHKQSYQVLIERLNKCGVVATGLCYGCIYTNPTISEIRIAVQAGTLTTTRVLDLTSKNSKFVCINMHE